MSAPDPRDAEIEHLRAEVAALTYERDWLRRTVEQAFAQRVTTEQTLQFDMPVGAGDAGILPVFYCPDCQGLNARCAQHFIPGPGGSVA